MVLRKQYLMNTINKSVLANVNWPFYFHQYKILNIWKSEYSTTPRSVDIPSPLPETPPPVPLTLEAIPFLSRLIRQYALAYSKSSIPSHFGKLVGDAYTAHYITYLPLMDIRCFTSILYNFSRLSIVSDIPFQRAADYVHSQTVAFDSHIAVGDRKKGDEVHSTPFLQDFTTTDISMLLYAFNARNTVLSSKVLNAIQSKVETDYNFYTVKELGIISDAFYRYNLPPAYSPKINERLRSILQSEQPIQQIEAYISMLQFVAGDNTSSFCTSKVIIQHLVSFLNPLLSEKLFMKLLCFLANIKLRNEFLLCKCIELMPHFHSKFSTRGIASSLLSLVKLDAFRLDCQMTRNRCSRYRYEEHLAHLFLSDLQRKAKCGRLLLNENETVGVACDIQENKRSSNKECYKSSYKRLISKASVSACHILVVSYSAVIANCASLRWHSEMLNMLVFSLIDSLSKIPSPTQKIIASLFPTETRFREIHPQLLYMMGGLSKEACDRLEHFTHHFFENEKNCSLIRKSLGYLDFSLRSLLQFQVIMLHIFANNGLEILSSTVLRAYCFLVDLWECTQTSNAFRSTSTMDSMQPHATLEEANLNYAYSEWDTRNVACSSSFHKSVKHTISTVLGFDENRKLDAVLIEEAVAPPYTIDLVYLPVKSLAKL